MTRADFETKHGMGGLSNATGYLDALRVFDACDAQLAEKDARIAELEAENAELAALKPEKIADRCPSCGIRGLFVGTGGLLTCSNVECENPCVSNAIAALKPKFEVGDTVEYLYGREWIAGRITLVHTCYSVLCSGHDSSFRTEAINIRLSQPKVTKPTADEWYEAWVAAMQVSGDERWEALYALALRQGCAKQTEVAK